MSSFFNQVGQFSQNLGNQVGQFSHTFGSQVGQLSANLGTSVNQAIQQGFTTTIQLNEELRIGSHTVQVKEKIAEGGFGLIVLVSDVHTQTQMVLKRCNIDREEVYNIVKKEISILQRFTGPYVTKLIENDVNFVNNRPDAREALLLLEYYPGGHLLQRLNQRQGSPLPAESIYRIFGQILMGVKSFHENNPPIINRDLKLENILFGTDGKVRLCDFGSCEESPIYVRNQGERERVEEAIQKETTQMYRAPEMINLYMRDRLTEKTDIWALGCIFYSLIFLKHPFQDVGSLAILQAKYNLPAESAVSPDGIEFLQRMLDIDPEARPSVSELLKSLVEIAADRPILPHNLSAEALKRREERIAADQLRESKNKKKAAPVAPARKGAPPAANSVAAKRLAAKRGQPIPASTVGGGVGGGGGSFDESFQPFDDVGGGGVSLKSNASEDFFSDRSPAPANHGNNSNNDDWFDSAPSHPNTSAGAVGGGGFDPFSDDGEADHQTHNPSSSNAGFDAFGGGGGGNDDFFDSSAANADFPTSKAPANVGGVRRPSFDEFTPSQSTAPPATAAPVSSSSFTGFDEFGDDFATTTTSTAHPASSTPHASSAAAAFAFGDSDFASSSAPAPAPATADFLFDQTDSGFTAPPPNPFAPPSRQGSVNGTGSRSSFVAPDFTDIDFSLPQAPPSRQSSVVIHNTGGFNAFDSAPISQPAPAPAPAPVANYDPFGSEILTPTVASSGKSSGGGGGGGGYGDLLDTSIPSTQQRKSVNLHNPMELLSLYEQPKPEPPKPSAMLNNSSAISSIPIIPTPGMGMGMGQPPSMRAPPPNPFAPPNSYVGGGMSMSARSAAPAPHQHQYGGAPMYGGGMGGGGGMYGGGMGMPPAPGGGYGSYSAPATPGGYPGSAGGVQGKIGNNPNAMKPSYGVSSDPFDSLNILSNNKR